MIDLGPILHWILESVWVHVSHRRWGFHVCPNRWQASDLLRQYQGKCARLYASIRVSALTIMLTIKRADHSEREYFSWSHYFPFIPFADNRISIQHFQFSSENHWLSSLMALPFGRAPLDAESDQHHVRVWRWIRSYAQGRWLSLIFSAVFTLRPVFLTPLLLPLLLPSFPSLHSRRR